MAKEPGNSRSRAKQLDLTNTTRLLRNRVGAGDRFDFFRFNLVNRSSFSLTLTGLQDNVNVVLLNDRGRVLQQSRRPGKKNEAINTTLEAGLYFIRVEGKRGKSRYRLRLVSTSLTNVPGGNPAPGSDNSSGTPGSGTPDSGQPGSGNSGSGNSGTYPPTPIPPTTPPPTLPPNTAPKVINNNGLSVVRRNGGSIASTTLLTTDPEQSAGQLVYTVTKLPQWGKLLLNNVPLAPNGSFTQDDINNNRVSYQNAGIAELASNTTLSGKPQISGSNVVWTAFDGQDDEIFFYNGNTHQIRQLSDNTISDANPQISGANVVWQSGTGNAAEIFFYEGSTNTTKRLTTDSYEDRTPRIDSSTVVWEQVAFGNSDIKIYEHSSGAIDTIGGAANDSNPFISGTNLGFERRDPNNPSMGGIYGADLTLPVGQRVPTIVTLGTQTVLSGISGSTVVWERRYSNPDDRDVEYLTLGSAQGVQSIDNTLTYSDTNPLISGSFITFTRNESAGDTQDGIYLFDYTTSTLTQILGTSATDIPLSISGSNVVWQRSDGVDTEIFFYDGTAKQTIALTGNTINDSDPVISGSNVVWQAGTGTNRNQLFFYNSSIQQDSFDFKVSDGTAETSGTFAITIS